MSVERTLERLLAEVYPDHSWIVTRRQVDSAEPRGDTSAGAHDHDSLTGGDACSGADGDHDYGFQQAA